jgi:hypothetical protein
MSEGEAGGGGDGSGAAAIFSEVSSVNSPLVVSRSLVSMSKERRLMVAEMAAVQV